MTSKPSAKILKVNGHRVLDVVVLFSVTNRAHIDTSWIIDMATLYFFFCNLLIFIYLKILTFFYKHILVNKQTQYITYTHTSVPLNSLLP